MVATQPAQGRTMTPDPDLLLLERDGPVAIITLNRPKQLNALSVALRAEIVRTVRALSTDAGVRVLVLTGSGRAFTAGVDLKEAGRSGFSLGTGGERAAEETPDTDMTSAFRACPHPVIGAINGFAITGGFELALMCDVLLASTEAKFADTHGRVGLMPVWGLSQKLPRIIGMSRAKELSLTGNFLDAATAERWGLVNRVLAPDELMPAARKLAHEMAQVDAALLKKLKGVMDEGAGLALDKALELEIFIGNAHNAGVTPEAAEASRGKVMERGRGQQA
jgi:enoyl-CoA hydratase